MPRVCHNRVANHKGNDHDQHEWRKRIVVNIRDCANWVCQRAAEKRRGKRSDQFPGKEKLLHTGRILPRGLPMSICVRSVMVMALKVSFRSKLLALNSVYRDRKEGKALWTNIAYALLVTRLYLRRDYPSRAHIPGRDRLISNAQIAERNLAIRAFIS
jgi:hypothetical protein